MPAWLQRQLTTAGTLDDHGRGRRAIPHHCRGCGLIVIDGYDDDLCARFVTVDHTPLNALGEANALVAGRYTRNLWKRGGRLELTNRYAGQIRHRPAGTRGNLFDVLAEHRCGWPLPPLTQQAPSEHDRAAALLYPPGSPAPF